MLLAVGVLSWCTAAGLLAQQQGNPHFDATVHDPVYPAGEGPRVLFDEAHDNFHTADGRYAPFVRLIEADGFRVAPNSHPFSAEVLGAHDILVISSARGAPPGQPGQADVAFTDVEANAVRDWVYDGGALLLITDHPPAATPPTPLAERFGITLVDATPVDTLHFWRSHAHLFFSRAHGTLEDHPITRGRHEGESVERLVTFAGNSIVPPPEAAVLLRLPPSAFERHSRPAVGDTAVGAIIPAIGTAQGIALPYGRGRIVALAEAAAWTSQLFGGGSEATGMDEPGFQNRQFILNVMRWLGDLLPASAAIRPAANPAFDPAVTRPTHTGSGPRVKIDGGHHNLFTADGRFRAFVDLIAADGYEPSEYAGRLTRAALKDADILVIAGPRGADIDCETALWWLGTEDCAAARPAFEPAEIAVVEAWVRDGGGLLLALDTFPSAAAGRELARTFGVDVTGGFVIDWVHREGSGVEWITFAADSGTVADHPATAGVDRAVVFGATSLSVPPAGVPLLSYAPPAVEELPARVRGDTTYTRFLNSIEGRAAAVGLAWGRGRVTVLGDADLLTSQLVDEVEEPVGLDGPTGYQNLRFTRTLLRWLSER